MRKLMLATVVMTAPFVASASAQVELKSYADAIGYIDVLALIFKANPDEKVIKVIGMVFDKMRKAKGLVLAK